MPGWALALIIITAIILFIGIALNYFKVVDKIIFPAPPSAYSEETFGDKLQYAKLYKKNGLIGKNGVIVDNNWQKQGNCANVEMIRSIPFAYLKNNYQETSLYMIHFHGNAEDMVAGANFMNSLMKYIKVNVFVVEYPGYGIYQYNQTNSQLIEEDALTIYDYIKESYQLQDEQIYIFGRSIGTGPAFFLASQRKCKGLIVMSAYKSIKGVVSGFCCKVGSLVSCCIQERFNNLQRSQQVKCPILFIHGQMDVLIKVHNSEELYQNLPLDIQTKSCISIRARMTHNDFDIDYDIVEPILFTFPQLKSQRFN